MSEEAQVVEVPESSEMPAAVAEDQNTAPPDNAEDQAPQGTEETTEQPKPETEEQKRSKWQRRIDRKNREIAEARAEARLMRERLEKLEVERQPQKQDSGAPKLEQFDNFEDYMTARTAYEADKIVTARLTAAQQEEQARRQHEDQSRVMQTWQERQEKAHEKFADYAEVVSDSDAPVTQEMSRAIVESDFGPEIVYFLAQNPEEAERISKLSPIRQIAEIGKLETKVSAAPVKKPTSAPPPIKPVGSKAKAEKSPEDMTYKEFVDWRLKNSRRR